MKYGLTFLFVCVFTSAFSSIDTLYFQRKMQIPDSVLQGEFASFKIDSFFYVVGGYDGSGLPVKTVWRYNIMSDYWDRLRDFPGGNGGLVSATGFSIKKFGFVCCGGNYQLNFSNEFWQYYPAIDSWQKKVNFPGAPREWPVAITNKQYAYVGLGWGPNVAGTFWRYNNDSSSWLLLDSFPRNGRAQPTVALSDSNIYIFAGEDLNQVLHKDVWTYNIYTNSWDSIGCIPISNTRVGMQLWSFDSINICGGGYILDTTSSIFYIEGDFHLYYPSRNRWDSVVLINFLDSVANGTAFTNGNIGYFFGGYKQVNPVIGFSRDMYSFDATPILKKHEGVGINGLLGVANLKIYPNPLSSGQNIKIETAEAGEISFHDILGQELLHSPLHSGVNELRCNVGSGIVFYTVVYHDGRTASGRVVVE
jgi:hypothetical protein